MRNFVRTALFSLYALTGSAVFAQSAEIPQEMLDLDNQRCVNDCVPGFGEKTCKPLCACTVREYKKRLDFDGYLQLSVQLSRNEISEPNRILLDDIAKMCTAELDASGIEIGAPASEPNK